MPYGYIGSMKTRPGRRDEVVSILLAGVDRLSEVGCDSYIVGVSDSEADIIWVTEVWQTREHHEASLQLPETKAAIGKAMPMLTGEFTGQRLNVVGGLGMSDGRAA